MAYKDMMYMNLSTPPLFLGSCVEVARILIPMLIMILYLQFINPHIQLSSLLHLYTNHQVIYVFITAPNKYYRIIKTRLRGHYQFLLLTGYTTHF